MGNLVIQFQSTRDRPSLEMMLSGDIFFQTTRPPSRFALKKPPILHCSLGAGDIWFCFSILAHNETSVLIVT